jgi:hypothetical protein
MGRLIWSPLNNLEAVSNQDQTPTVTILRFGRVSFNLAAISLIGIVKGTTVTFTDDWSAFTTRHDTLYSARLRVHARTASGTIPPSRPRPKHTLKFKVTSGQYLKTLFSLSEL